MCLTAVLVILLFNFCSLFFANIKVSLQVGATLVDAPIENGSFCCVLLECSEEIADAHIVVQGIFFKAEVTMISQSPIYR